MRNDHVAEPFRSMLNQFSGGTREASNPLLNVPEQYKQRASYDFVDGRFKVCAGGYGLAECEDSEVAHAICLMWNAVVGPEPELVTDEEGNTYPKVTPALEKRVHDLIANGDSAQSNHEQDPGYPKKQ